MESSRSPVTIGVSLHSISHEAFGVLFPSVHLMHFETMRLLWLWNTRSRTVRTAPKAVMKQNPLRHRSAERLYGCPCNYLHDIIVPKRGRQIQFCNERSICDASHRWLTRTHRCRADGALCTKGSFTDGRTTVRMINTDRDLYGSASVVERWRCIGLNSPSSPD